VSEGKKRKRGSSTSNVEYLPLLRSGEQKKRGGKRDRRERGGKSYPEVLGAPHVILRGKGEGAPYTWKTSREGKGGVFGGAVSSERGNQDGRKGGRGFLKKKSQPASGTRVR